ncbi:hypothetical protein PENTCL1PPCAC_11338, partial [Pristionchus entomophagus]
EEEKKEEEEEFCMGDHKILRPATVYPEGTPASWVNGNGERVIRLDRIQYPTTVPSRERVICLDLRRYEGSEDVRDIKQTERIISWRGQGLEYYMSDQLAAIAARADAAAATAVLEAPPAPPLPPSSPPAAAEGGRMKSPRPTQQTKNMGSPAGQMMPSKQKQGMSSSGSSQVRLVARPPPPPPP